ncbi:MAG TPA: aldose epimerase family protein [Chitinophagaceae bacterium]|nr:aldose epimerase family protein [Chitinophagaceae bacterium]
MKINPGKYCFKHPSGPDIFLYNLKNTRGMEVSISNYGAIITSLKVIDKSGRLNDMVLGFDKMEDYFDPAYLDQYPWFGAAVGRYANRIGNADFEHDGKKYSLTRNRPEGQLHGGPGGFDRRAWEWVDGGRPGDSFLELKYFSKDGEEGFPGNLSVTIRYELNENSLSYEFTATTDKATPVNLTHHSYFNFNNGEGRIEAHEIKIPAARILEQDGHLVATGNYSDIADTAFDFREFKSIGEGLKQREEFDQSYVLDKGNQISLVAEARYPPSGIHLQILSTEPVVHFYSGKWIPAVNGKNATQYGPFSGFCLETMKHANAVKFPHFPNTILHPWEKYFQKTVYQFNIVP